jgi:rfaE bifunctional protein nucleotidyltransferase chain/domain
LYRPRVHHENDGSNAFIADMSLPLTAKILKLEELLQLRRDWQSRNLKVVFTNGVFDLLHRGHVDYLLAARKLGDVLVVGVNTDASVRRLKGPQRPLIGEDDRTYLLACLRMVEAVTLFDEATPLELISALKPDILVKGADYKEEEIVGAREVKAAGGSVKRISLTEGRSTSSLVEKILEKYRQDGIPPIPDAIKK